MEISSSVLVWGARVPYNLFFTQVHHNHFFDYGFGSLLLRKWCCTEVARLQKVLFCLETFLSSQTVLPASLVFQNLVLRMLSWIRNTWKGLDVGAEGIIYRLIVLSLVASWLTSVFALLVTCLNAIEACRRSLQVCYLRGEIFFSGQLFANLLLVEWSVD